MVAGLLLCRLKNMVDMFEMADGKLIDEAGSGYDLSIRFSIVIHD